MISEPLLWVSICAKHVVCFTLIMKTYMFFTLPGRNTLICSDQMGMQRSVLPGDVDILVDGGAGV